MSFDAKSTAEEVTDGIDLSGQTWLITGVNSGLGYESARVLALRGARIVGLARTEAKARTALSELGIDGMSVACELSDLASVRAAVATVSGLGPLDGIMANAGIMAMPELHQKDGVELQFLTNHVGHAALVNGLVDQLTETGRVVILSSMAHFMAKRGLELDNLDGSKDYEGWRLYGRSKLANVLYARALANRFRAAGSGRTAYSLHPGVIETNLARHIPNRDAMFERLKDRMKTLAQGAATQCYVATQPGIEQHSGKYFSDCAVAPTLEGAVDDESAEQLWEVTERLVG